VSINAVVVVIWTEHIVVRYLMVVSVLLFTRGMLSLWSLRSRSVCNYGRNWSSKNCQSSRIPWPKCLIQLLDLTLLSKNKGYQNMLVAHSFLFYSGLQSIPTQSKMISPGIDLYTFLKY